MRFNFGQFFLSNDLSKEIEPICRRSEVLPVAGNGKALLVLKSVVTHSVNYFRRTNTCQYDIANT